MLSNRITNYSYQNFVNTFISILFVFLIPSLVVLHYLNSLDELDKKSILQEYNNILENQLKLFQNKLKTHNYLKEVVESVTSSISISLDVNNLSLDLLFEKIVNEFKNKIGDYPLAFAIIDYDTKRVNSFIHPSYSLLPDKYDKGKGKFEESVKLYFLEYYINRKYRERVINIAKVLDQSFFELFGWGVSVLGLTHEINSFGSKFIDKGETYWAIQTINASNSNNKTYTKFGYLVAYNEAQINYKKIILNAIKTLKSLNSKYNLDVNVLLSRAHYKMFLPYIIYNNYNNELTIVDVLESRSLINKIKYKYSKKIVEGFIPIVKISITFPNTNTFYKSAKTYFSIVILIIIGLYLIIFSRSFMLGMPVFKTLINNLRFAVINIEIPFIIIISIMIILFSKYFQIELPEIIFDRLRQEHGKLEMEIKNLIIDENYKLLSLYPLLYKYYKSNFDIAIGNTILENSQNLSIQNIYVVNNMGKLSSIHRVKKFHDGSERFLKLAKHFASNLFKKDFQYKDFNNHDDKIDSYKLVQSVAEDIVNVGQFKNLLIKEYTLTRNFIGNQEQWLTLIPVKESSDKDIKALYFLSGTMSFIKDKLFISPRFTSVLDYSYKNYILFPLLYGYSSIFSTELNKVRYSYSDKASYWYKYFPMAEITRKERTSQKLISYDDESRSRLLLYSKLFSSDYLVSIFVAKENFSKSHTINFYIAISLALIIIGLMFFTITRIIPKLFTNQLSVFMQAIEYCSKGNLNWQIIMYHDDEFGFLAQNFNLMRNKLIERYNLSRFVPTDTLYHVEQFENDNNKKMLRQGREAIITILYSDIRDFTSLTEKNSAEDIITMLNEYFTIMERTIAKYGGVVINFIGDAILAYFPVYNEYERRSVVSKALECAKEMKMKLKQFNETRKINKLFTINNGIAVATDWGYYGIVGSKHGRLSNIVLGKVLDKAIYLESQTAKYTSSGIIADEWTINLSEKCNKIRKIKLEFYNNGLNYAYEIFF